MLPYKIFLRFIGTYFNNYIFEKNKKSIIIKKTKLDYLF